MKQHHPPEVGGSGALQKKSMWVGEDGTGDVSVQGAERR